MALYMLLVDNKAYKKIQEIYIKTCTVSKLKLSIDVTHKQKLSCIFVFALCSIQEDFGKTFSSSL